MRVSISRSPMMNAWEIRVDDRGSSGRVVVSDLELASYVGGPVEAFVNAATRALGKEAEADVRAFVEKITKIGRR